MALIKRSNSTFWYIQFQLFGKTHIRSSRTTSKKAAEQMEIDWRAKLHAERYLGEKDSITLKAAVEQFCDSKVGTPNYTNLKASSNIVGRLMPLTKQLDQLTSHDLERFKRDRLAQGVKTQTVKHNLNLVKAAWKYAKKLGYRVGELEFPQLKTPRAPLRYITAEEEQRLLSCLDPKREIKRIPPYAERSDELKRMMHDAYDLVILLLDTGARYSEIANIEWARIDLDDQSIRLWRSKVQNETVLYMSKRVFETLTRRKAEATSAFVFANKKGGPRGYASLAIRKAIQNAGLKDCKIHTLRHTHASRPVSYTHLTLPTTPYV